MKQGESSPALPIVVLDTNAVLDWLPFRDPGMHAVQTAIQSGAVSWLASARMRQELLRILDSPALSRWQPNSEHTLALFDRWAAPCPEPDPTRAGPFICSDRDDQVFIDLALAHKAKWLITHDLALHKLARRAALMGLRVLKPKDWPSP